MSGYIVVAIICLTNMSGYIARCVRHSDVPGCMAIGSAVKSGKSGSLWLRACSSRQGMVGKPGSQAQSVCCARKRNIFLMKHKGMSLILLWVFASSVFGQQVEGQLFDFGTVSCESGYWKFEK